MEDDHAFPDDPLEVYLAELKKVPPWGLEEEAECIQHVRTGDKWAENSAKRLLEANLHLVVAIAERFTGEQVHILDLIQQGNSGLLTAIQTIRDSPPEDFPILARSFVERAIAEYVGSPRANRIPPHLM